MRAVKFVNASVADAVASGSLKVGTLRGYASLESDRRDEAEGTVVRTSGDLHPGTPEHEAMRAMAPGMGAGLTILGGANDVRMAFSVYNLYCFCIATDLDASHADADAAFDIADVQALANRLTEANYTRLGTRYRIERVRYEPRSGSYFDRISPPNPFVKDNKFEGERELRIIWPESVRMDTSLLGGPSESGYLEQGLRSFITSPDQITAKLLRRLVPNQS